MTTPARIYLDNAATTPLDPQVLAAMLPFLEHSFGNPSSTHWHGRQVRSAIEKARKTVAELLHCSPSEIVFTSGGTEADNYALRGAIECFGLRHAISSPTEHHAVLHTLEDLEKAGKVQLSKLQVDAQGRISLEELKQLLEKNGPALVSLMHGNNEIGNLQPIEEIADICKHYGAYFHSDTVQTMGHYAHDTRSLKADYLVGAAHKFHGPKGIGFLYMNAKAKVRPCITGGSQERGMRGGTENVCGIVGLAKALELAYEDMSGHQQHISQLKALMIESLQEKISDVRWNGLSGDLTQSLYTVLSVSLPPSDDSDMLLFNLDLKHISASGGSACSSGSELGSHVLRAIGHEAGRSAVRFSFSRFNSSEDIRQAVEALASLYQEACSK